jgi:hypothetical protein
VDITAARNTGLAIANANPFRSSVLTFAAFQADGAPMSIPTVTLTLPANGHTSKFVTDLMPLWPAGVTGVLEVTATEDIAPLTVRSLVNERGEFLMATFPVIDVDPFAAAPFSPLVFPQFADGGGYRTEIILVSPGGSSTVALLQLTRMP